MDRISTGAYDFVLTSHVLEHVANPILALSDHDNKVAEDDLTHMTEILVLHDLQRDPEAGDRACFADRSKRNFENRCLHHHVFATPLAARLVKYAGMQIHALEEVPPMHILVVAQKSRSSIRFLSQVTPG